MINTIFTAVNGQYSCAIKSNDTRYVLLATINHGCWSAMRVMEFSCNITNPHCWWAARIPESSRPSWWSSGTTTTSWLLTWRYLIKTMLIMIGVQRCTRPGLVSSRCEICRGGGPWRWSWSASSTRQRSSAVQLPCFVTPAQQRTEYCVELCRLPLETKNRDVREKEIWFPTKIKKSLSIGSCKLNSSMPKLGKSDDSWSCFAIVGDTCWHEDA